MAKKPLFIKVSPDLIERARNAAFWNPRLTLSSLTELGLTKALAELEKQNQGPYPARQGELKRGIRVA